MHLNEFDSLEILSFKDSKGEFQNHFHDSYVISIIEKGVFKENELFGAAGSMLISHPYEVHENKLFDNNSYSSTSFYINADVMHYIGKQQDIAFPDKLIHNPQLFQQFKHYLLKLQSTHLEDHTLLVKCLEQLICEHAKPLTFEPLEIKDEYLLEVLAYMSEHCHTKIKLDDLASMAKLNKYQFIRQFKKNVGLTPFEYINLQRTTLAKRLLRDGESIVGTALASGYYDQSHLNHYFKNYIGLSPGDYVKSQYFTRHLNKKQLGL